MDILVDNNMRTTTESDTLNQVLFRFLLYEIYVRLPFDAEYDVVSSFSFTF